MKWPEAYAILSQEASTLAEALVVNFCRFGVPRDLHSNQDRNLRVSSDTGGFATPGREQDANHAPATAVGRHGGTLYQNVRSRSTYERSHPTRGIGT
jgi:hypothetical protein